MNQPNKDTSPNELLSSGNKSLSPVKRPSIKSLNLKGLNGSAVGQAGKLFRSLEQKQNRDSIASGTDQYNPQVKYSEVHRSINKNTTTTTQPHGEEENVEALELNNLVDDSSEEVVVFEAAEWCGKPEKERNPFNGNSYMRAIMAKLKKSLKVSKVRGAEKSVHSFEKTRYNFDKEGF